MSLVAFDLDGVLVDSVQVVRDAYLGAGVEAPENIFALEGVDWITPQLDPDYGDDNTLVIRDIRRMKNVKYLRDIGKARLLPPYRVARRLRRSGHTCVILSGAPVGAIDQVQRRHGWTWPFVAGMDGLRTSVKQTIMLSLARDLGPQERPVYVDDQEVMVPEPWRLVWYRGQSEDELMEEMRNKWNCA